MATRLSDQGSVETLFQQNEADLRSYVGAKLGKSGAVDVDDIVQEAFLRIASQGDTKDIKNPRGFLFRIARNLTFDLSRRRTVRRGYAEAQHAEAAFDQSRFQSGSAENTVSAREDLRLICKAIEDLPSQCRRVFLLQRRDGMSYLDIARHLKISESMVQKHMSKALSRLYRVLP